MWTNIENNLKYIGSHKGHVNDGYIGSGKRFQNAIKKHGIHKFRRDILEFVDDAGLIMQTEQKYLDMMVKVDPNRYYNISLQAGGGDCGNGAKISATKKANPKPSWLKGKQQYLAVIEKLSDDWEITTPDGNIMLVKNMASFCRKHRLNPSAMSSVARGKRQHYKGYFCKKISNNRNVEYNYKQWTSRGHATKANFGSKNGQSKPFEFNGIVYETMISASRDLGVSMYKLRKWKNEIL